MVHTSSGTSLLASGLFNNVDTYLCSQGNYVANGIGTGTYFLDMLPLISPFVLSTVPSAQL